jgi:predicted DNA-binding transcriptional regulator AlpA
MRAALDMAETAAATGYSWERFRRVWRALPGFPAPIKRPTLSGRGAYAWRAESVEAWVKARESALGARYVQPVDIANDIEAPRRANAAAIARQRAALGRLMRGA